MENLLRSLSAEALTIIILLLGGLVSILAILFFKDMQRMLREIIKRLDHQDLENRATKMALSSIFAENKMTNGLSFIEKKMEFMRNLMEEYQNKGRNDKFR